MSVAEDLAARLAAGDVVIIDGGTGTQLQADGATMDSDAWSARANLDRPDLVRQVHQEYIRAGAEVIIANTFAASRAALAPAGLGDRLAEVNQAAVAAALAARDAVATRPVAVAGAMSSFCPVAIRDAAAQERTAGEDPRFPALSDFREQAALLAQAGVDLIALELIESTGYGRAAVQAATETGLPVWLGIGAVRQDDGSLGTDPVMGRGESLDDLLGALVSPDLAAVTVMHTKPELVPDTIGIIRRYYAGPVGAYAESGDWAAPNWVFDGLGPEQYLEHAVGWAEAGAQLIGGCCGIGPEHIRLLAQRLG
jgi:S-methylmethionine-dependent homocysteine/selenocysteine methylase